MNPSLQGLDPRIHYQGVHVELTESLQATIFEKFGALLRHNEQIVRIEVRRQKAQCIGHDYLFNATGQVELRGPDLVAHAEGKEAYGVLEAVANKLDRLLEKRHGIRKDKRNHPHPTEIGGDLPKLPEDAVEADV